MSIFQSFLELYFSGLKSILFYPEYQKMFVCWLFYLEKKKKEKGRFFDKNQPLAKCPFFRIFQNFTFQVKKAFFTIQNIKICLFLALFAQKKHIRRRSNFCQKPCTNPFAKCPFFRIFQNFNFQVQKTLFSIQNIKKCFFLPFLLKKNVIRKRSIFTQKPWTNPFAKCRFFRVFQHFSLLV